TLPPPPGEFTQPRRHRWRYWLGVPVILLLLALVGVYGLFFYWSGRDVRAAMAEAERDLPEGWQLEDIEAHRAQVPDGENAALVEMKLRQIRPRDGLLVRPPPPAGQEGLPEADPRIWFDAFNELSPEVQLDEGTLGGLRASLSKAEPARALARKLAGMTR